MGLKEKFVDLFEVLREASYLQSPRTPQQLQKFRHDLKSKGGVAQAWDPFEICFGVGSFFEGGPSLVDHWIGSPQLLDWVLKVKPAVSNLPVGENLFICHEHWPPRSLKNPEFVYFGRETERLLSEIEGWGTENSDGAVRKVLDLGCGAGALSLYWVLRGAEVCAVDLSPKAVAWTHANLSAHTKNLTKARFQTFCVDATRPGFLNGEIPIGGFDAVMFNPPMVLEEKLHQVDLEPTAGNFYPHRNGGELGIWLQNLFYDRAHEVLRKGGLVFALSTNPILKGGRTPFLRELDAKPFRVKKLKVLDGFFNQKKYHEEAYVKAGIERVELLFVCLSKK